MLLFNVSRRQPTKCQLFDWLENMALWRPIIPAPFKSCTQLFGDYEAVLKWHFVLVLLFLCLVAAQGDLACGWETKVVEFFKDKLKEKDTRALVKLLCTSLDLPCI